eukprot:TRINITY_DN58470_c0_g6_i1.p1 TRINITY_DN58470_c0_g6~~TRINITY_DN58470_c0_g6_i1.p1  ORF type:complete len:658 (+),score=126.42 TRINITY_DN58470_c0_g6_i1:107-2080(+)
MLTSRSVDAPAQQLHIEIDDEDEYSVGSPTEPPATGDACLLVEDLEEPVNEEPQVQVYWGKELSGLFTVNSTALPAETEASGEQSARILTVLADMQEQLNRMMVGQADLQRAVGSLGRSQVSRRFDRKATGKKSFHSCPEHRNTPPQLLSPVVAKSTSLFPHFKMNKMKMNASVLNQTTCLPSADCTGSGNIEVRRSFEKNDLHRKSRNAFDGLRTVQEDKAELYLVFEQAERIDSCEMSDRQLPFLRRLQGMLAERVEMVVDSVVGLLIVLNALFIGISMDVKSEHADIVYNIDLFFTFAFILELFLKIYVHGPRAQFCGKHYCMNSFDATLIVFDVVQLAMQTLNPAVSRISDLPSASLFRVVRLCRLVRILRLLRHPVFQTLLMMLHGMAGGLPTLGWALVLFVASVYIVALLCRECLGREESGQMYEYFENVPRSMVTTFRCSFGECVDIDGTPIFEHVGKQYGLISSFLYCFFAFAMSVGMFNVISAIFVESTLEAATRLKWEQKKQRLQDDVLFATRVSRVVRRILEIVEHTDASHRLSDNIDVIYDMDISRETMDRVSADPAVQAALEDLDVDPEDYDSLSDILDVDENGTIVVMEMLQAIKRLRGNPRRSDIVRVDLVCRSIQSTLKDVCEGVERMTDLMTSKTAAASK